MKYRIKFHTRAHALLMALLIVTASEAFASSINPETTSAPGFQQPKSAQRQLRPSGTCDPQMKLIDGVCRPPTKNLVLKQSIVVQPTDPPYDCDDGFLVPARLDKSNDPANDPNRYQATSSPQIGIFVPDAHHVQIRKCHIIGFDFGIFAVNGKTNDGGKGVNNTFADNEIIAHYAGISLLSVDNTEVAHNNVTLTQIGGRAINVQWNSDRNNLHHNTITGDFDTSRSGARLAPATDASGNLLAVTSNPSKDQKSALQLVFIGAMGQNEPSLMTAIVDGSIYQFTLGPSPADSDFAEDNVFESNTMKVNLPNVYEGLSLALARRTVVQKNTFKPDMKSGIRIFTQLGTSRAFPGTCSLNHERLCVNNTECSLEPAADTCQGVATKPISDLWTSVDNRIEANSILGPFSDIGIATAGRGTRIIRNTLDVEPGRSVSGPLNVGGIALFGQSYGNTANPKWGALVSRNTVSNVWPALTLAVRVAVVLPHEGFTARIGLNDFFTVYSTVNGVRVPNPAVRVMTQPPLKLDYLIPTDISINFKQKVPHTAGPIIGNFWGLDCPDRFLSSAVTPSSVLVEGNTGPGIVIDDSHALNDPVSGTETGKPTPRCPSTISGNRSGLKF